MNIATRKIEVYLTKGERSTLNDWSYACRRMSNIALSRKFAFEKVQEFISLTEDGKEILKDFSKEGGKMNTTNMNFMYKELSVDFSTIPSNIRAGLTKKLSDVYRAKKSEIHKGLSALPTFKNGTPIPFNIPSNLKKKFFTESDHGYTFVPFGKKYGIEFETRFGRDRSGNRSVVENIVSGHFQLCDSQILLDKKKIFLLLTFKSPTKQYEKDDNVIVSMNLGMNVPVYVACTNGKHQMIGNKDTLLHQRKAIQGALKRLQKQARYGAGGKGRKKKLQSLERFKDKERNFVKTTNHKLSYDIIKFAISNNAGKILIEDLKGISRDKDFVSKYVLRNWSYFELQQMIQYKAKKFGIDIEVVPTNNITQRCVNCGFTSEENITEEGFMECKVCQHKVQKDHNAALNILHDYTNPVEI